MESRSILRKAASLPRQLLVLLVFFPLLLFWTAGSFIASLFDATGNLSHRCLAYLARSSLALARLRVQVQGLERLDPAKTYIFMPNHASFLDILLMLSYVPHNFRFIIKAEALSIPLLGTALRRSLQIPIDRKNPRRGLRSLRQAADLLAKGVSIVVFPEGSRTRDGKMQELKATLFILPIRTRFPVVPVLIEGTFEALRPGSILLNRIPLRLTFFDAIPPEPFGSRDRTLYADRVRRVISRTTTKPG